MNAPTVSPDSSQPDPRPTMLLVDGSSYLYRAFHAMPDLRGPENVPTGAIHGIVNMLRWLRDHIPAEHAVCVFDAKYPNLTDFLARIHARPAYRRALERGGEYAYAT